MSLKYPDIEFKIGEVYDIMFTRDIDGKPTRVLVIEIRVKSTNYSNLKYIRIHTIEEDGRLLKRTVGEAIMVPIPGVHGGFFTEKTQKVQSYKWWYKFQKVEY